MHFTHIKIKGTKEYDLDFSMTEFMQEVNVPEESKKIATDYIKSKKLDDESGFDSMMLFDRKVIFSFDYLHNNQKLEIPELNPVLIFYTNALRSLRNTINSRDELLKNSPKVGEGSTSINISDFGNFFAYASNCIINLQAALESFANSQIPYERFLNEDDEFIERSISHKLFTMIPAEKGFRVKKPHPNVIEDLIQLRNKIIHLKPQQETNTGYKNVYRKLLKFDYERAVRSTRLFINHYQTKLIEDCECGKEFFYVLNSIESK